jgi:hypothetical protein
MTVIAVTVAKPHAGKRKDVENRARTLGGIYARHGAAVKIAQIAGGPNTGCIILFRAYENFQAASKAFQAANSDPAHIDFWREREANPAAEFLVGRDLYRGVYGTAKWGTHPVSYNRTYDLPRDKVADAVKIVAEAEKVTAKAGVNIFAVLPVTGENLSSFIVSYQFRSPDHFGEAMDTVGTSEPMQAIIAKAAKIGTIRSAILMTFI